MKDGAEMKNIRNFCLIAHIDHRKSTLADRLLDFTGAITDREKQDQLLDDMDLERERHHNQVSCHSNELHPRRGRLVFNLIDTPGHVDFSCKYLAPLLPVKEPCWWLMRHRAFQHKPSPIYTSLWRMT